MVDDQKPLSLPKATSLHPRMHRDRVSIGTTAERQQRQMEALDEFGIATDQRVILVGGKP